MNITSTVSQQVEEALLDAFPDRGSLERMVSHGLGENLAAITGGANLTQIIFELVRWAIAQNRLRSLIRGARQVNPRNALLLQVERLFAGHASTEFVNRANELAQLNPTNLKSFSSPYTLVYAPAGYGKTYLLDRLINWALGNHRLREQWAFRYIDFKQEATTGHFIKSLWGNDYRIPDEAEYDSICDFILQELASPIGNQNGRKSVLLILDSFEQVGPFTSSWLYELFTRLFERTFQMQAYCIRIILSGRNLNDFWEGFDYCRPRPPLPLRVRLTPFDIHPIQELVAARAKARGITLPPGQVIEMAEEIEYTSGGHPKAIRNLVNELDERGFAIGPVPKYFSDHRAKLVKKCVLPIADELLSDLDEELQRIIRSLSVFRMVSGVITLRELMENGQLPPGAEDMRILSRLLDKQILSAPTGITDPFYRGDLIRRVLSICMQYGFRDQYRQCNRIALNMYEKWAYKKVVLDPIVERILPLVSPLEWLYHALKHKSIAARSMKHDFDALLKALNIDLAGDALAAEGLINGIKQDSELCYLIRRDPDREFLFLIEDNAGQY